MYEHLSEVANLINKSGIAIINIIEDYSVYQQWMKIEPVISRGVLCLQSV